MDIRPPVCRRFYDLGAARCYVLGLNDALGRVKYAVRGTPGSGWYVEEKGGADPFVTLHVSPYVSWQGPRSKVPPCYRHLLDGRA